MRLKKSTTHISTRKEILDGKTTHVRSRSRKRDQSENQDASAYERARSMKTLNKSEEVRADKFEENISATTRRKIVRLLRLQLRQLHLRQLQLATLGGSTSTRP
jgi:DNA repair exonuclease SbcCD ATPase subunit